VCVCVGVAVWVGGIGRAAVEWFAFTPRVTHRFFLCVCVCRYAAHDRLGTYFVHAMQMSARDIARRHAGITKRSTSGASGTMGGDLLVMQDAVSTGARQYKNICSKRLKPENYEACLLEVCEAMCGLMVDFDSITAWHAVRQATEIEDDAAGASTGEAAVEVEPAGDGAEAGCGADPTPDTGAVSEAERSDSSAERSDSGAAETPLDSDSDAAADAAETSRASKAAVLAALDDSDPLESLVEVRSASTAEQSKTSSPANRLSPGEYSGMKLEVHRRRLWLDVQRQIGMFLDQVTLPKI
jgi:hypothetical protein